MSDTRVIEWTAPLFAVYGDKDGAEPLAPSRDIYYAWRDDRDRWVWACTSLHTLVSREPLHLEPSIGWMACCGRHGFIRNGLWEPAGDGGWKPA